MQCIIFYEGITTFFNNRQSAATEIRWLLFCAYFTPHTNARQQGTGHRENGTDLAQQYLDSIRAVLNDRASEEAFQEYKGKLIPELMYGAKAGISSFANDVNNWFLQEDDYIPPTSTELTSQRIREDLSDESISWYNMRTGERDKERDKGTVLSSPFS